MPEEYGVTTNEIMDFLKEHMVTKEEFYRLEGRVDNIEHRMDRLEVKVDKLDQKIDLVRVDTATLLKNKEIITKQEGIEYIRGAV